MLSTQQHNIGIVEVEVRPGGAERCRIITAG
jgi:hypothetical protein